MKPIKKLEGKTVAIVGMGRSWFDYNLAKSHGVHFDEVWAINAVADVIFHDRIFMLDPSSRFFDSEDAGGQTESMKKILKTHEGPIYTCELDKRAPGLVLFPVEEVVRDLNCYYLNNTVAYAIAFAVWNKVGCLKMFGVDFTYTGNLNFAEAGRGCVEFWLSKCQNEGMLVEIANSSTLLDTSIPVEDKLYGYHRLDDPKVIVHDDENKLRVFNKSQIERGEQEQKVMYMDRYDSHLKESKAGDPNKITPIGTKEMPIHHGRMKGMKLGDKIIAISPSWNDIGPLDIKTNSVKLQNFEKARNTLGTELLTVWEEKKPGWERRVKEINALARRESDKIPKALRGLLYFETLDLETGKLKGIGGNPMRFEGKNKPGADIPFKELGKKVAKKAIKGGTTLGALTLGAAYEALGAPLGREVTLPTKAGEWLGPIQLTASGATQEMKELTDMVGSLANKKYAEGGSVEPRIPYRDGTSVAPNPPQEKSWEDTTAEWDKTLSAGGFNNDKPMYQKFGDMVDAESLALYYPALLNEAGLNVADFATRLPKVAKYLFEDVLTTPVGTGIDSLDVDNSGIHKAWTEITRPYEWSKKVPYGYGEDGIVTLDDLITNREAKMKAAGKSDWPVIAGKNIQLGAELVAPIFPGLKAATSVAKSLKNSGTQLLDSIMSQKGMNTNVIDEALTDKGMSRRDFNKIVAVGGLAAALKAAGLSDMFKVAPIKPTTAGIKILRESSTKMPAWFPQFVDKISAKMIYEGDGISKYVGTADELPGVEVTKNGENWTVAGKNEYGQDFELHYEAPGYIDAGAEGGSPVFYKGDFTANDSVPSSYVGPEDVDYDPSLLTEVDEVLGGTRQLEEFATGKEVKTPTVGENRVTQAEMKAEYDYDMWREQQADDFIDE